MLESNLRYGRLVEDLPDGILLVQNGEIAYANAAAVALAGAASPDLLVGRPLADFFDGGVVHFFLDGSAHQRMRRVDGTSIDVQASVATLEDEPPPLQLMSLRDVTGRSIAESAVRESEERLRLAFDGAQEGVWDWNLETGAVVYSPRWKQMLGYEDHEIEPHVREWERLLHPDDLPAARALNESVQRGAPNYEGEFRLRHKDGHYIHVLSRGFPVRREPGGDVVRIVGTHFDLTERQKREAERARTELLGRLVFAQEDERRRIAREMHDQFGEQLTSLSREIALLRDACAAAPDLAEHIQRLERISQQLDRDVDHLVWQLRPTALDDLGLRAALANYVQDWAKRVKVQADLHMPGLLGERLPIDVETTLYRIAQEALTNVARHARASRVDVMLERQGDAVLLTVEDNGVGFEPDVQVQREEGGFGLLGMHERAALVGATLQVESARGSGTTVLLRLTVPRSDHA